MSDKTIPILARGLTRVYRGGGRGKGVTALDGLDLTVRAGEVLGLLGPNGSGKSTTMKLLLGLTTPTRGTASVFGKPPGHRATLRRVGYLPEETRLFSFLTARETVRFFGALAGYPRARRKAEADRRLEEFGLAEVAHRRVKGFSKGMARRLGLACTLVGEPDLLMFDEPTSGLDPLAAAEVKDLIRRLKDEGRSVLLSSHLLADVQEVCDRIVLLGDGRLIREGPAKDLLALKEEYEARFRGHGDGFAERIREFIEQAGGEDVTVRHATEDLQSLFMRIFRNE